MAYFSFRLPSRVCFLREGKFCLTSPAFYKSLSLSSTYHVGICKVSRFTGENFQTQLLIFFKGLVPNIKVFLFFFIWENKIPHLNEIKVPTTFFVL